MTREEAIRLVREALPEETLLIASNGHVSRQLYAIEDRPTHFYMIGSMGLGPSIALGIAAARPGRHLAVLDGDGNVLMNLGGLASVAARRPMRLTHVCVDNGRHASTGGQRTISDRVDLSEVARGAGYVWTGRAETPGETKKLLAEALGAPGPAFLLIKVAPGGLAPDTPRVALTPEQMTRRFRELLGG